MESYIIERQKIILYIKTLEYTKKEFKYISEEIHVVEYEKKLIELSENKKYQLKYQIDKVKFKNSVNKNYNKSFKVNGNFFSTKI